MLKHILLFFIFTVISLAGGDGIWDEDETGEEPDWDTLGAYLDTTDTHWRSEARVDTFGPTYMFSRAPGAYAFSSAQNYKVWGAAYTYGYINLYGAGQYTFMPIELMADSVYIDSIAWHYGWYGTPPDADTIYLVYSDSTYWTSGNPVYYFTQIDTVGASEIVKNTYGQRLIMSIDKGYNLGALDKGVHYPRMGIEYEKETGSGAFKWTAIIIYYTRFMRR